MIATMIACPHCQQTQNVVKFGKTESGTQRAKCKDCNKTFGINPKSRAVTPEKEAAIERHLSERTTIRGICRVLKVSPNTIYTTLKKSREPSDL
jgi:transposase-like protein